MILWLVTIPSILFGICIEKMKRAMPPLNPQAESYTPLEKRKTEVRTKIAELSNSLSKGLSKTEQCQSQDEASSGSSSHANEDSQNLSDQTKMKNVDNSHEMTLAYLAFLFPNISEQCLADVYFMNETDLDATTDMLEELEVNRLMYHCPCFKIVVYQKLL